MNGLCECGCGGKTTIARKNDRHAGMVKGQPARFIVGHNNHLRRVAWTEEDRGHETPCHIWQGRLNDRGYGETGGRRAYRVRWERERGPVPDELELDHLCRQRDCVNLDHLEPVTHQENMRRSSVSRAVTDTSASFVRGLRVILNLSQGELADRLGVSRQLIGMWERGTQAVPSKRYAQMKRLLREPA